MKKLIPLLLGLALALGLSACGDDGSTVPEGAEQGLTKPDDPGKIVDGKADAWNFSNNPERFQMSFVYKYSELPTAGRAEQTPWPDTYWPTYMDGANWRWQGVGELSPLEKFDKAFNSWTPSADFLAAKPFDPERDCGKHDDEALY